MTKLLYRVYPALINVYTVWLLYMLYFATLRNLDSNRLFEFKTVPFDTMKYYYFHLTVYHNKIEFTKNIVGNIVLFIPYGFLGILYPRLRNGFWLMLTFFVMINLVEFSQYYFHRGTADIDDIILNTLGVIIGYLIYRNFFFIKDK